MKILSQDFKFIDLFAGVGGFHYAMKKVSKNAQCLLASEINENAIKIYFDNHHISSNNDVTKIETEKLDYFDVLCGGFPCQSFSKAGNQDGFNDARGTLFFEIARIIKEQSDNGKKPKIIILENVRNLITHDENRTWEVIYNTLTDLGYNTIKQPVIVSPSYFGIPQIRERAVILAVDNNIYSEPIEFELRKNEGKKPNIYEILEEKVDLNKYSISDYTNKVLEAWDYFIKNLKRKTLGFPIWSDEFGQDYIISHLPEWKKNFIEKNRKLYNENKEMIDDWKKKFKVGNFVKTHRKFEWQASENIESVFDGIIQFRPSGVRVKKPDLSPTLVAMSHIPIIGKYKRYITPREAARLQSLPESFKFDNVSKDIYRLLGNAVNVDAMYYSFIQFIEYIEEKMEV